MYIQGNTNLNNISALSDVTIAASGYMNISYNPLLSEVNLPNICNHFATGGDGDVYNNTSGANSNQEVFKKQRPKLTEERIKVLNNCYAYVIQVNAAAQLVFRDDFAKQKQYVFSPSSGSETQEYKGTVTPHAVKSIATIPFALENVFTFRNTGVAPLVFCLSAGTDMEGIQVTIGGGAMITKSSSELNPNGVRLLVKNNDPDFEGSYEVELDD